MICVFNWSADEVRVPVKAAGHVTDLWTGKDYGQVKELEVSLKAHEGTVLVVR
jgi:hypothetical protein